ncbi:response regulator [Psychromonas sp. MME2]|uniref:response regulator n=1 Tax=Psychromonas sp. MME2 TaxID=3231033 RepID=UPI00339C8DB5
MFNYKDKNILIVDDQKAFHIMLRNMLTNQGASAQKISFAENAEGAVKLAEKKTFDLFLVDYNLGSGKNGVQLIDFLRQKELITNHAICFIITGDNNKGMVLTALEKSPDDYLMKPFSQTQLLNRLRKAAQKKEVVVDIFDALQKQEYSQAIALCKEKINQSADYRKLCKALLADIYIEIEKYEDAERILKPLVENRPLIRASISLGKAYYLQDKLSEAINLLNIVIQNSPLQIEAYQWLSRTYKKNGELEKALATLSYAASITNHSIERHQEVAILANEMNEHKLVISSYSAILQLSRNSFYPNPCHLANYIRCILEYALSEDDLIDRKIILKQVSSALYQSRFEEGRNKDFDFNCFDEICQSKVFFALNEPLKAKRKLLSTLEQNDKKPEEFETTLLCEALFFTIRYR